MTPYWIKQEKQDRKQEEKVSLPYWILNRKSKELDYIVTGTINRISSFCFTPELADKTISLQCKQFRTQRKDINELIVKNIKLYTLSIAEIEKYLEAIKFISRDDIDKIDEINKIDIEKIKIKIDLGGFSLELAKLLGTDYLRGNYVIVSVKQKDCDILRNYTSFDDQIRTIFNNSHNLDQFLLGESLIGSYKSDIRNIAKNPDSIFRIEIDFESPIGAISKLKKIKECENRLLSDSNLIKNTKFLDDLYADIDRMISKHGYIDRLDVKEIKIRTRIDSFKFSYHSDKETIDIYCLKDKIPIFIYFSESEKIKDKINSEKMKDKISSEITNIRRDDFILLNGLNEKQVLISLISEGIIGYSPYIGLERAANMIIRKRREILNEFLNKNPESSEDVRKLFLENLCEDIPEKAKELLMAVKKIREGSKLSEIGSIVIYTTFPLVQNEILYELLSRLENLDIKSLYANTERFVDKISKMEDNELKIFLRSLLESLEFKEEYNEAVNAWLMNNKKEICEEIGVKFRYEN